MSKFVSDKMIDGRPERERIEDFCGHFAVSGNSAFAYRLAYVVDESKTWQWVLKKTRELLSDPEVAARVQEMKDEAAAKEIVTVQSILRDLQDIATADPNELISVRLDACRHCWGEEFEYQWIDETEYWRAHAAALDEQARIDNSPSGTARVTLPTNIGGYGFHPGRGPNELCPHCFGRGVMNAQVHDSTKVSPAARKLYAGAKITKDGIEIKMHDQMKARELVGKVLGVFKDGIPVAPAGASEPGKRGPVSLDDARAAYLKLIG